MNSVTARVDSDAQLARLLQIAIVLEEVVEVRAYQHYRELPADDRDDDIEELLSEACEESAEHRERLEALVERLNADTVPFEEVRELVIEGYAKTRPEDFDGVLYDQLNGEETAYKFYDDLIAAIEGSDASFSVERERLLGTLSAIREEEAEGAREVAQLMEDRG